MTLVETDRLATQLTTGVNPRRGGRGDVLPNNFVRGNVLNNWPTGDHTLPDRPRRGIL